MLRISHKQIECIGCDLCCQVAPNYWYMNEDGLAQLHSVVDVKGQFQMADGFEEDLEALKKAEEDCPVNIIKVTG